MTNRADWSVHTAARITDEAGRWLRTCHGIWTVRNETEEHARAIAYDWAVTEAKALHLMDPVSVEITQTIRFHRKAASGPVAYA
jgi:hypothetical protein